jgi:hypothetical protein
MNVYQFTVQHGDLHYDRWRHVQVPFGSTTAGTDAMAKLDALEDTVVEQQHAAATPKQHTFEVVAEQ